MYCTKEDIEVMLQLKFDENSLPSESNVELFIEAIASEINLAMKKARISVPPTDADVLNTLKIYNCYGTAGLIGMTYGGNVENIGTTQGVYYRDEYKAFIQLIKDTPTILQPGSSYSGAMLASNNFTDGYTSESDLDNMIGDDWTP